jgi:PadR family transcriptional regulator, regulatory protein AphA
VSRTPAGTAPQPPASRRGDRLSPAEFTLLGLIAFAGDGSEGVHGYDLNRQLNEGALAEIIRLEPGMLYHYLKKLARRELITTTIEQQTARPDRHLHALTRHGRAQFQSWLSEPVQTTREIRLEFLLKLWFARTLDPERARSLVQDQREVIQRLVTSLERQMDGITGTSDDDRFARKVIELRLAQNRAADAWLAEFFPRTRHPA